ARVVRDTAVLERDVVVHAHEHAPAAERAVWQVANGECPHVEPLVGCSDAAAPRAAVPNARQRISAQRADQARRRCATGASPRVARTAGCAPGDPGPEPVGLPDGVSLPPRTAPARPAALPAPPSWASARPLGCGRTLNEG